LGISLICRFLGNACIELIGERDHIIVDPVFLSPPKRGIERIFITHEHSDHIDIDKIDEICREYTREPEGLAIYGPKIVRDNLFIELFEVEPQTKVNLKDGLVLVFENECWKSEECVAYLIEIEGKKILHTADSAKFSNQLRAINSEIDCCFIACFERNYNDYLEFLRLISPKLAIPYHFTRDGAESAKKLVNFLKENNINSRFLPIGGEIEINL
jgi:L-ascorbate metabolism protein UlaG (beta-lactamase superfamily)